MDVGKIQISHSDLQVRKRLMLQQEFQFSLCPVCITNVMKPYLKVKAHGFAEALVIILYLFKLKPQAIDRHQEQNSYSFE